MEESNEQKSKEPNAESLSGSFLKAWKLFQQIEKSEEAAASDEYQENVKSYRSISSMYIYGQHTWFVQLK